MKSQEKRERKSGKIVGMHAVGGWGGQGGRGTRGAGGGLAGRKKERKKGIADNKNPDQLLGRDKLVLDKFELIKF